MKRFLPGLFSRLKMIALGYLAAAFAAGAAILGGASLLALAQKLLYDTGGVTTITNSLMALVFLTGIIAVIAALPAFGLALLAELFKMRHWSIYVLGGVALTFAAFRGLNAFQGTADFLFFVAAGMLGGTVYWRVAGRHAGNWQMAEASLQDDQQEDQTDFDAPAAPTQQHEQPEDPDRSFRIPPPGL